MDDAVGMIFDIADLIHAVREVAARRHIGKDNIARIGEERLSELIALARIPRNVEFHHWKTCSLYSPPGQMVKPRQQLKVHQRGQRRWKL
jgi:hypothetical protein